MGCVRLYYNSETKLDASWLRDRAAFLCLLAVRRRRIRSRLWSTFYFTIPRLRPSLFPIEFLHARERGKLAILRGGNKASLARLVRRIGLRLEAPIRKAQPTSPFTHLALDCV